MTTLSDEDEVGESEGSMFSPIPATALKKLPSKDSPNFNIVKPLRLFFCC